MSKEEFAEIENDDDVPQKYKWVYWLIKMVVTILTALLTALGVSSCTPIAG